MTDIIIKNPLIAFIGEKLNIIQINFENAEGSTKSENQGGSEKPSNQQKMSSIEKKEEARGRHACLKKLEKDEKNSHSKKLGRKTKRRNVNIYTIENGKILFKVFNEFKLSSSSYKEYYQFNNI